MQNDYTEIGEQLFNLIDNDKDKRNEFFDATSVQDEKTAIKNWFDSYVNPIELSDLFKEGQTEEGFYDWLVSKEGHRYFIEKPSEINQENIQYLPTRKEMTSDSTKIHADIEDEDSSIMSTEERIKKDMSDGNYQSDNIDNEKEIEIALDALDSSEEDIDIVFDIMDGSDDLDSSENDSEIYQEDGSDDMENEEVIHKRKIHLDHHVNKVVEEIDNEEEIDRFVHKKYYVMKKKELGSTERLNELEEELDNQNISYYDFGKNETIAIKIYTQNEVRLNRIFEKLDFEYRCVDIAHYTDNWNS